MKDDLIKAIDEIKIKINNSSDKTRETRARKGAYVDALMILKNILSLQSEQPISGCALSGDIDAKDLIIGDDLKTNLERQSQPLKEDERYIEYLKAEYDFQLIQLDGLNISKDQSFEQRINTAIMMAWKTKGQSVEPLYNVLDEKENIIQNECKKFFTKYPNAGASFAFCAGFNSYKQLQSSPNIKDK